MTVTEFLEARIAEDEAAAREPRGLHWSTDSCYDIGDEDGKRVLEVGYEGGYDFEGNVIAHMARWDPARVLAECAAKRAIMEGHGPVHDVGWKQGAAHGNLWCGTCGSIDDSPEPYPCDTLKALAAVYSDHPDYDKDWAL